MKDLVILTNFVPPYRVPVFKALQEKVGNLYILVSTTTEPNRFWQVDLRSLHLIRQRCFSWAIKHKYHKKIKEKSILHIPYDTMLWLHRLHAKFILSGEMGARTIQALLYKKIFAKDAIVVVHADLSEVTERKQGGLRSFIRKWIIRQADGIIVNGSSGRRYIRSLGGNENEIFVVPYTTDIYPFAKIPRTEPSHIPFELIYVGQLIERKGLVPFIETLVRWCQTHPSRKIRFTLVGDGPLRNKLAKIKTPQNLVLNFTGFIPYCDLPNIYARTDLLVFPTFADTWGLVVNEALAAGVPVLGSLYSQAVEEMIEDEVNGWTFCPDDPVGVYRAIDRALSTSPDKLLKMREIARKRALALAPGIVAEKILQVFDRLARKINE